MRGAEAEIFSGFCVTEGQRATPAAARGWRRGQREGGPRVTARAERGWLKGRHEDAARAASTPASSRSESAGSWHRAASHTIGRSNACRLKHRPIDELRSGTSHAGDVLPRQCRVSPADILPHNLSPTWPSRWMGVVVALPAHSPAVLTIPSPRSAPVCLISTPSLSSSA